jgi:hypothetical protein
MATTTHEFTRGIDYSAIVATSERVAWTVDQVFHDRRFDTPKALSQTHGSAPSTLAFLNEPEQRTLNHLRAFSYVHLLAARRNSFPALFADLKGSMDLMENLDPEDARAIVDPALRRPVRPQPAPAFREGFLASQV